MSTVRIMHVSCCTCQSATPTQQFFLSLKIVVCSDAFFDDFSLLYLTFPLRVCLGSMQVSPDCTRCEWTQLNCAALLIAMLLRKAQNTTSSVNMWCFFFFLLVFFYTKFCCFRKSKLAARIHRAYPPPSTATPITRCIVTIGVEEEKEGKGEGQKGRNY